MIVVTRVLIGVFGPFHLVIWAVLNFFVTLLSVKKSRLQNYYFFDAVLLMVMISCMFFTQVLIGSREIETVMKNLLAPVLFLIAIFSRDPHQKDLRVVFFFVKILLLLDFTLNFFVQFFNFDLFGRTIASARPGDWFIRVQGVFGHTFASINLSVACLILAIARGSPLFILLSALNLALNGSFRAPLALSLIICIIVALKMLPYRTILVGCLPIYWAAIVLATLLTSGNNEFVTGNALRIVAWTNAYLHLLESPLWGVHTFAPMNVTEMHSENIKLTGNAEGNLLQLWLDYGLIPIVCLLLYFLRLMVRHLEIYRSDHSNINLASAAFSAFAMYDLCFGSFYGTPIMVLLMWALRLNR